MIDLKDASILVTGGTGSFGKKFVKRILENFPTVRKLVIYSRDELKQFEMSQVYSNKEYKCLRYFIGDIRDKDRFRRACEDIDIIIHAAALKQVPAAEYNPIEFIRTNILGAENIIDAALDTNVKRVVALSTDKAAAPVNLYGATKLCSDKLFVAANNMKGKRDLKLSIVRYGNVIGSRGSVVPFFLSKQNKEKLPITDSGMTRFNITLEEGVDLVLYALENALGGEIFVPKIPSYRITDMAEAISPNSEQEIVGIRPGEKLHEEMITESDSLNTIELDNKYIILPSDIEKKRREKYLEYYNAKNVEVGFKYNSGNNPDWLTVDDLRKIIKAHVDPGFSL